MRFLLSLFAPLALIAPAALAQPADPARDTVQALDEGLLAIMKAGRAAGVGGRSTRIAPVVDHAFDLPLMTRLSIGAPWTGLSTVDQSALVAAVRRLTIAQYARNFDAFSGERFVIAPGVETRGGDRLVRTTLTGPGGAPVAIAYRLRQAAGGQGGSAWKIIDVFYRNAISQLATRRSDFAAVLASGGARSLVAHLDALAAKAGE